MSLNRLSLCFFGICSVLTAPFTAVAAELWAITPTPNPLRYEAPVPPAIQLVVEVRPEGPVDTRSCTVLVDTGDGQPPLRVQFDKPHLEPKRTVSVFYLDPGRYTIEGRGTAGCAGSQRAMVTIERVTTAASAPSTQPVPPPAPSSPATAHTTTTAPQAPVPAPAAPTRAPAPAKESSNPLRSLGEGLVEAMKSAAAAELARCPNGPVLSDVVGDVYPGATLHIQGTCLGTSGRVLLSVRKPTGAGWYNSPDATVVRWEDNFIFATVPPMAGVPDSQIEIGVARNIYDRTVPSNLIVKPFNAVKPSRPTQLRRRQ